jgi:hypothetical protein
MEEPLPPGGLENISFGKEIRLGKEFTHFHAFCITYNKKQLINTLQCIFYLLKPVISVELK